jgi:hypothetical protein
VSQEAQVDGFEHPPFTEAGQRPEVLPIRKLANQSWMQILSLLAVNRATHSKGSLRKDYTTLRDLFNSSRDFVGLIALRFLDAPEWQQPADQREHHQQQPAERVARHRAASTAPATPTAANAITMPSAVLGWSAR